MSALEHRHGAYLLLGGARGRLFHSERSRADSSPLLQTVDRGVAITNISNCADNKYIRKVRKAKDLAADDDNAVPRIADIVEDVSTTGNGSVTVKVKLQTAATTSSDDSESETDDEDTWTDVFELSSIRP